MRKFVAPVLCGVIVISLYTYVTLYFWLYVEKPLPKDTGLNIHAVSKPGNPEHYQSVLVSPTALNATLKPCKSILKGQLFNVSQSDILTDLPLDLVNTNEFLPMKRGGFYDPGNCEPLMHTAVIIPYRNREKQLNIIINNLHRILQRQRLNYGIFVIELSLPTTFNIGVLMNMGFLTANNISAYDCFVFHDVDLIPLDDRISYQCDVSPMHMSAFNTKYAKVNIAKALPYSTYVGGVISLRSQDFKKLNGFSNAYFGWGGTDDDIDIRAKAAQIPFRRENPNIGRYYALPHDLDINNSVNQLKGTLLKSARQRYMNEGLTDRTLDCILLRCGVYLDTLDLSASPRMVTTFAMDIIGKHCPSLKKLDLTEVNVTDVSLRDLASKCTQLHSLTLTRCLLITDKGVGHILQFCKSLAHLDLAEIPLLTGKCFKHKSKDHRCLKTIILTKCHKNLRNLRVFVASGIFLDEQGDEAIGCLQQLEHVDLSFSRRVLDTTIIALAHGARNISIDRIVQTGQLRALVAQATKCVTDEVIINLATLCPCVEYLDLSGCFQITARIFDAFRNESSVERHAKIELKLGGTAIDWESYQVDWVSGYSHLDVSMHNLAINELRLRPDMDILLASYDDDDDDWVEGEDFAPQLPVEAYQQVNVEYDDDWDEDCYGNGFLENDDPLEEEQWNMS